MKKDTPSYLFAYGTLQSEFDIELNKQLSDSLILKKEGYFIGRLFEVSSYPGAFQDSNGYPIYGQVFEVTNKEAWRLMDDYEECSDKFTAPHEYKREKIEITSKDGEKIKAWTYLYNHPTNELEEINSGDYIHFYQNKN